MRPRACSRLSPGYSFASCSLRSCSSYTSRPAVFHVAVLRSALGLLGLRLSSPFLGRSSLYLFACPCLSSFSAHPGVLSLVIVPVFLALLRPRTRRPRLPSSLRLALVPAVGAAHRFPVFGPMPAPSASPTSRTARPAPALGVPFLDPIAPSCPLPSILARLLSLRCPAPFRAVRQTRFTSLCFSAYRRFCYVRALCPLCAHAILRWAASALLPPAAAFLRERFTTTLHTLASFFCTVHICTTSRFFCVLLRPRNLLLSSLALYSYASSLLA